MKNPSRMRSLREQFDKCRNFTGISSNADGSRHTGEGRGTCKANIKYDSVCKQGSRSIALPCFFEEKDNLPADGVWPKCSACSFKSGKELDDDVAESERHTKEFINRMVIVRPIIIKAAGVDESAEAGEDEYGQPMQPKPKTDQRGIFDCPICKTGKLGWFVSSYNGHVRAACATPDCVSWME